jgi:hypothetical protein
VRFPRQPRRRRRGAHRREGSGEEVGQCSGPEAATGGEEAIGAVELNREGVEGGVRRGQELTGEAVTAARWFRWKSGHEKWPGSVSEVRRSFPGGYNGAGRTGVGCPRRTGGCRS